ncbi:hypothetical protein N7508_006691 [Penicillium antarcticum]|nr:uncharacterized protein N7508_006691 [Penicillium antarcticum]KAJ5301828.1 hypothetical protein N7508_006691 [Penicillium antarcticum]
MQEKVLSGIDHDVLSVMELWTVTIDIKLAVCDSSVPFEVTYDGYIEQFRTVIEMAESLLQDSPGEVLPAIIIQTSLVPALLWCGVKCRNRSMRSEIVRLLDKVKGHNAAICVSLMALQKVIEYESGDAKLENPIPEAARLGSIKLNIQPGQDQVDLWYRKGQLDPHLHDDDNPWVHNNISVN